MPSNPKAAILVLAASAIAAVGSATAATATPAAKLGSALASQMRTAGSYSGAYVVNLSRGGRVFGWKSGTPRILASNTKLFTTSAALARYGTEGTLGTEVLGRGRSTRRASGAATCTCAAAGTPPSGAAASRALLSQRRDGGKAREGARPGRDRARDRPRDRGRVAVRLPPRRPGLRLRACRSGSGP